MIRHVAGVADIVEDVAAAVHFYREVLGLPVEHEAGTDYATIEISGILHFGIWGRRAAAESVFGDPNRASEIPLGFTLGFEVDNVADAEAALAKQGVTILQSRKEEPWGQVTSRFLAPGGGLNEVSETPWARETN